MGDNTGLITLLTIIAGFVYQEVRLSRQRRWDREDRAALATSVVTEAKSVALKVVSEAQGVADKVVSEAKGVAQKVVEAADAATLERHKLADAIDVNTAVSTKAFHEANTVNQKLEALGLEHNALRKEQAEGSELISETVVDTQERVKAIEAEVVGGAAVQTPKE